MRSFEKRIADFHARHAEVVAISVDSNEESRKLCASRGYTFPLLSDPKAETIRKYGVLHPKGSQEGNDIARPGEFLVDAAGTIRWVYLAESIISRTHPNTVLRAIDGL